MPTTVIIAIENAQKSHDANEILTYLPASCNVLSVMDVVGDVDNLVEIGPQEWGRALQRLTDSMPGARIRALFTHRRDPLHEEPHSDLLRAMTFVRLVDCEKKIYPQMFADQPRPCNDLLEFIYRESKEKMDEALQSLNRKQGNLKFTTCYGHGMGFPPGMLIDGRYRGISALRLALAEIHKAFKNDVKTISYLLLKKVFPKPAK